MKEAASVGGLFPRRIPVIIIIINIIIIIGRRVLIS